MLPLHGAALAARLRQQAPSEWFTRFAPSPTGWLHLGHAVNAVFTWGLARAAGGKVLLRIEDHDRGRSRAEYERGLLDDLDWLGLEPDIGSIAALRAGPSPWRQSDAPGRYLGAFERLEREGAVYPCACSRKDVAQLAGATPGVETAYPGTCRSAGVNPDTTPARRLRMAGDLESFDDIALGPQVQCPAEQCGDVLVRDRAGYWTYQFAVVVDDIEQGVDVVIRGEDLLSSTGRQIQMGRRLGRTTPCLFLHHPLVLREDGTKLSKSTGDTGIRELREEGWPAARVLGEAAFLAGLQRAPLPVAAAELAALFAG